MSTVYLKPSRPRRLFVAVEPVDFRQGIDGLAALCRRQLGQHPQSGAVFVFRNRRSTAIKLLVYDGQGFWLCHKRLSSGRFRQWPQSPTAIVELCAEHVHVLVYNGDPQLIQQAPLWCSLPSHASPTLTSTA